MTDALDNMTLDGFPPAVVLAKLIGKLLLLADAVTEKWVTAEVVYVNSTDSCGAPYHIICDTTDSGHVFALNLADALEALVESLPQFLASLASSQPA
jgi:hypothetical protein